MDSAVQLVSLPWVLVQPAGTLGPAVDLNSCSCYLAWTWFPGMQLQTRNTLILVISKYLQDHKIVKWELGIFSCPRQSLLNDVKTGIKSKWWYSIFFLEMLTFKISPKNLWKWFDMLVCIISKLILILCFSDIIVSHPHPRIIHVCACVHIHTQNTLANINLIIYLPVLCTLLGFTVSSKPWISTMVQSLSIDAQGTITSMEWI